MNKVLFLLCPTDCLETKINNTFKYENYFYTSLGNSFYSDFKTINSLKELLIKKEITNICFILSTDNRIINDALEKQSFSKISGLKPFYKKISKSKKELKIISNTDKRQYTSFSYLLNTKIKELQLNLGCIPDKKN